jgi:hypothetical protein
MTDSVLSAGGLRRLDQRNDPPRAKERQTPPITDLIAARRGRAQAEAEIEAARARAVLDSGRLF